MERRQEHEISGLEFSHERGGSMSVLPAPEDYRWHHSEVGVEDGDGTIHSSAPTKRFFRQIRREFLSTLHLEISQTPEKGYRYWRWSDPNENVKFWERRLWNEDLPHEAGFWPDNGGHIEE